MMIPRKRLEAATLVFLFLAVPLQGVTSMVEKSPTWDEPIYIGVGKYLWETGNFNINSILYHPPLSFYLNSIFLMFLNIDPGVWQGYSESYTHDIGLNLLYQAGHDADSLLFLSRLPFVFLSMALAFIIYRWAGELYGKRAAFLALALYVFSPNILAHSRLITTDFTATFFVFLAVYSFWRFIRSPGRRSLLAASLTFGLALLSKWTALYLVPIYIILGAAALLSRGFKPDFRGQSPERLLSLALLFIFASGLFLLNAGYGFKGSMSQLGDYDFQSGLMSKPGETAGWVPVPLPEAYVTGLDFNIFHSEEGNPAFLMGEYSELGWWYYFPVAFLLKTPIPTLILILASLWSFKRTRHERILNECFLAVPAVFLFLAFIPNHINIGLRHILPIYPFIFIFVSKVANLNFSRRELASALLVLWYIISSLSLHPHYLAYFNEIAGGPDNGYRYLVDSNLDWGQDMEGLKKYMDRNNIEKVYLSYFGSADPEYYGISYTYLPGGWSSLGLTDDYVYFCGPLEGILAVGATELMGPYLEPHDCYSWLLEHKPVGKVGYSIFIYNITGVEETKRIVSPTVVEALVNLGKSFFDQGKYVDAATVYGQAIMLDPENPDAHYNLGTIYGELGRYADAAEELEEAVSLDPENADAYYNLGVAYYYLGRMDEALLQIKRAAELNPGDEEYQAALENLAGGEGG
jgi:4-amino-4-deoxy-L-arabinose transferase-like glycosyltransferase